MKQKNKFGILLQRLMIETGLKNSTLAEKLQYDVSYISKWNSGRFLPSEKNADRIADEIAACIVESLSEEKEFELSEKYHASDPGELKDHIYHALLDAFYESKNKPYEVELRETDKLYLLGVPVRNLIEEAHFTGSGKQEETEIAAVIDVFSLDHESRLILAGIAKGRFAIRDSFPDVHFSMILNAYPVSAHEETDYVYDSIFLIHMLTSFSKIDFQLYNQPFAYGKYIYAERDRILITGILSERDDHCFGVTRSCDVSAVNAFWQKVKMMCSQETQAFRRSTIAEMVRKREYMQSVLSTEVCFLMGHITELLVPAGLFDILAEEIREKWEGSIEELRRLHQLSCGIMEKKDIHIMIYESAFTNFIVSGELDFYNYCLYLTPKQRLQCLEYIFQILQKREYTGIKLIEGGFSADFQYITNPCLFMSAYICYLRLENGCYENNILILNDKMIRNLFRNFWQEIWNRRSDIVIGEREALMGKMEHYLASVQMLADME